MKHLIFTILSIVFLFSCSNSEEIIEIKESNIESVQTKGWDNGDPTDPAILDRMDLRASLELASYIAGRTILRNVNARNQIIDLSIENGGVISFNELLEDREGNNPFFIAFDNAFHWLWRESKPGDEEGGIKPDGYKTAIENVIFDGEIFGEHHKELYYIFLEELNCLELFFPVPLEFNENNMRITVTIPRLSGNQQSNIGGELYEAGSAKINAGHHLLVDTNYLFSLVHTDNNLLILRPVRTEDETCEYPTDIYTNTDFNAFLNF